jgi:hypothetical protein
MDSMISNAYVFAADNTNLQTGPASAADVVRAAATPSGPSLTIQNPLGLPASNRFVFNRIQIPNPQVNDLVHDTSVVRLTNSGSAALVVNSLALSDTTNWQLVNPPAAGTSIAPGASLDVTVKFIAQAAPVHSDNQTNDVAPTQDPGVTPQQAGGVWNATLTIATNDPAGAQAAQLAGYWQRMSEHEEEPSLQTIVNLLAGYGTQIAAQPNTPDLNQTTTPQYYGEETVSGLWQRADTSQPVQVTQLAVFHTQIDPQSNLTKLNLGWFPQGSTASSSHTILSDPTREGQMFFPGATNGSTPGKASFSPGGVFGWNVDGESSVDSQNTVDINQFSRSGHAVRFFPLRDSGGNLVANTYIMALDYENSTFDNNDFQDAVFIVQNIKPQAQQSTVPTPTNFAAAVTGNNVALSWSAVSGSSIGYNVYRATSSSGAFTKLNSTPIQATSFTDTAPPAGQTYFYRLTAIDTSSQTESTPATATAAGVGAPPPVGGTTDITIGTPAARSLKFTDADGTVATILLKGGTAVVHFTGTNVSQQTLKNHTLVISGTNLAVAGITATGTTAASTLTINAKGGDGVLSVGGLTADGGLRSINARTTDLTGTVSLGGPVGTITVGALGSSSADTTLTATAVGRINVAHDAVFDLSTPAVQSIAVKGNLHDSSIRLTGTGLDLKSLTAGTIADSTIRADGSIGTISTGQMTGDKIYAGIGTLTSGQTLPSSASSFIADNSISAIRVKKGKTSATFSDTAIAASTIGSATLGSVALANGGTTFGLASRNIRSVSGSDSATGKAFHLTKLVAPANTATLLTQQGITPQDFVVRII